LRYRFNCLVYPEIIGGYTNPDGSIVTKTRVSNMSHLSNKKNITIQDNVFIGHFNYIDGHCSVKIGTGVQITNHISILTHSSHHAIRLLGKYYIEQFYQSDVLIRGSVEIGAYTFVGAHATIMPGSVIGKGCIIGAYSYVDGSYPDYSIIKGQPAKVVGSTKDADRILLDKYPEVKQFYYE